MRLGLYSNMPFKQCHKCKEEYTVTSQYWVLVGPNTKRAKARPQDVGKPYGACKKCRNKAQIAYQKTSGAKKRIKEAYKAREGS